MKFTPTSIIRAQEIDFLDTNPKEKTASHEDIKFLKILNWEILHKNKGYLEMHFQRKNIWLKFVWNNLRQKLEEITSNLWNMFLMKKTQKKSMAHQITAEHGAFLTIEYTIHENLKKYELCSMALLDSGTHHWMTTSWYDLIESIHCLECCADFSLPSFVA